MKTFSPKYERSNMENCKSERKRIKALLLFPPISYKSHFCSFQTNPKTLICISKKWQEIEMLPLITLCNKNSGAWDISTDSIRLRVTYA